MRYSFGIIITCFIIFFTWFLISLFEISYPIVFLALAKTRNHKELSLDSKSDEKPEWYNEMIIKWMIQEILHETWKISSWNIQNGWLLSGVAFGISRFFSNSHNINCYFAFIAVSTCSLVLVYLFNSISTGNIMSLGKAWIHFFQQLRINSRAN